MSTNYSTTVLPDVFGPDVLHAQVPSFPLDEILAALEAGELPGRKIRGYWLIERDSLLRALQPDPRLIICDDDDDDD